MACTPSLYSSALVLTHHIGLHNITTYIMTFYFLQKLKEIRKGWPKMKCNAPKQLILLCVGDVSLAQFFGLYFKLYMVGLYPSAVAYIYNQLW